MAIEYNWKKIRTLLIDGFTEDELRDFCKTEPVFRIVRNRLGQNDNITKIAGKIMEFAEQRVKTKILLDWAKKENLAQYRLYYPYYPDEPLPPEESEADSPANTQPEHISTLPQPQRSPAELEAAGQWQEAASAYADLGQFERTGELLMTYARSLAERSVSNEVQAQAWQEAKQAFEMVGAFEQIEVCQTNIARYRYLPQLKLELKSKALTFNSWTQLPLHIHNQGYGPARHLSVQIQGGQFENGFVDVPPNKSILVGQTEQVWLNIPPCTSGNNLPLQLTISYQDYSGTLYNFNQTFYLEVSNAPKQHNPDPHLQEGIMTTKKDVIKELEINQRRLQKLRDQRSYYGKKTDAGVLMEIEDTEADIERLQQILAAMPEDNANDTVDSPPISFDDTEALKQRLEELEGPLKTHNRRIKALEKDLSRVLDSEREILLEERLEEAKEKRDKVQAEINDIKRRLANI